MGIVALHVLAFAAAALAPASVITLLLFTRFVLSPFSYPDGARDSLYFGSLALIISVAHVVVLGVPAFLILRWLRLSGRPPLMMGGFVAGSIPIALSWWQLVRHYANAENSGSLSILGSPAVMIDGAPTLVGWVVFALVVVGVGLLGAFGAFVFRFTLSYLLQCANRQRQMAP